MALSDSQPRFEAKPEGPLGEGWSVDIFWASEKPGVLTGFRTQYEALDWIKHKSANWVADKIMEDPGL